MLHIAKNPAPEVIHPFSFPLDTFQKHAVHAIQNNDNVLVTAKTGSGKTLVGEYQIIQSLQKKKRVFYTTPIKSLSNQKFHDLKKQFPSVGIMTGDIKYMPHADIVIMTTEILRNLLFRTGTTDLSLENLDAVIFDEVHYINDNDRGKVWEECLTLLDPSIQLILLSATIEQPEQFGEWLVNIKKKNLCLISTTYRIVPLIHMLPNKSVLMDSEFHASAYQVFLREWYETQKKEYQHKEAVRNREEGQVIERDTHTASFLQRMNDLIETIDRPALFFVFSRRLCSEFARKVVKDCLDSSETASVTHIVNFHLHGYPEVQKTRQYFELLPLLQKGVAYHHSGLLPILKEIVEILFERGLVRVLFATETFAVGINMPTKTVVFTSYRKFDDACERPRILTPSEYTQMAGRAGRRGKDDKGIVIYLPIGTPEPYTDVLHMMTGKSAVLTSHMDFGYAYILATTYSCLDISKTTLAAMEDQQEIELINKEIVTRMKLLKTFPDDVSSALREFYDLDASFKIASPDQKKKYQAAISRWKNAHMHPKWDTYITEWKLQIQEQAKINTLRIELEYISTYRDRLIEKRKNTLRAFGYLDGDVLTFQGTLASQVHEADPLLLSYACTQNWLSTDSVEHIVASLSIFIEEKEPCSRRVPFYDDVRAYAENISMSEDDDMKTVWCLSTFWFDPVIEWIQGNDSVCETYSIEHGNFVRAILKLANIVDEWVHLAILSQHVEIVERMKDVRGRLVRGFVVPDSLYLRI
uniref:Helicase n=1 Tax=viral metagenome TaxID=1070528 RepID=A0A6C0JVP6_9ZZZZ